MRRAAMILLSAAAWSCGSPTDGGPQQPDGPDVLTPAGGTVVLANGAVTVVAPAGAVTRNVKLSVAPDPGSPADPSLVYSSVHRLSASPSATLQQPIRIVLRYDPATGPGGVPEHQYGISTVTDGGWSELAGAAADTAANTVTANVTNFGTFAVRRASPGASCTDAEHRQFDFWIGEWRVGVTDSDITVEPSGCAIFEHYKAPVAGRSISVYDARTGKWYQTYHPGVAAPFTMSGGLVDGRMVMYVYTTGGALLQRWTWERNADGIVTQSAASTTDNGATWQAGFNGTYRRR